MSVDFHMTHRNSQIRLISRAFLASLIGWMSVAVSLTFWGGVNFVKAIEPSSEPTLRLLSPLNKSKIEFAKSKPRNKLSVEGLIDVIPGQWEPTIVRLQITQKANERAEMVSYGLAPEKKEGKLRFKVDLESGMRKGNYILHVTMMASVPKGQKDEGKLLRTKPHKIEFEVTEK